MFYLVNYYFIIMYYSESLTIADVGTTPSPVSWCIAKAVVTQDVIVSGTTVETRASPSALLFDKYNIIQLNW